MPPDLWITPTLLSMVTASGTKIRSLCQSNWRLNGLDVSLTAQTLVVSTVLTHQLLHGSMVKRHVWKAFLAEQSLAEQESQGGSPLCAL